MYIYPLYDVALKVQAASEVFIVDHQVGGVLPSVEEFTQVLEKALDDTINRRLLWAKNTHQFAQCLEQLLPWYHSDHHDDLSDAYYCYALDTELARLQEWIFTVVPKDTWRVWYFRRVRDDVYLEKGQDYRVLEFERVVMNGELTVEDHLLAAISRNNDHIPPSRRIK